jgi:alcohol dehydrogenase class IV
MAEQKYTLFSAGELENEIAGKWAYQPLGLLMVYASKLADEFYEGVNDTVGPMLQDTVDDLYDAYAEIKDENIKVKSLKQLRAWLDAVIRAFEVIETTVTDPAIRGVFENKVAGKGAQPLGTLVAYGGSLWHDTSKAVAIKIGLPLRESVDSYYAKDKAVNEKNAKIKALKRIRLWLDVVIDAVSYVEERTDNSDFTLPKKESK